MYYYFIHNINYPLSHHVDEEEGHHKYRRSPFPANPLCVGKLMEVSHSSQCRDAAPDSRDSAVTQDV